MGQNFASSGNSGTRGSRGSKVLFISVVGVALVAMVFVVVAIWHPWEQPVQESSAAPTPHTYSLPADGTETDVDAQDGGTYDAVDGWAGYDATSDIAKLDKDAGYLPMNEALKAESSGVDENGIPVGAAPEDAVEVDYDGNKVMKYIDRKHKWLEFSSFSVSAYDTENANDEGIVVELSGLAYNPTDEHASAESLPPAYIDGKPMMAYVANGGIDGHASGGFKYKFTTSGPEFDLTIYGFVTHVRIEADAEPIMSGDTMLSELSYPLLDQAFVDEVGNRIRTVVIGTRSMTVLAAERE